MLVVGSLVCSFLSYTRDVSEQVRLRDSLAETRFRQSRSQALLTGRAQSQRSTAQAGARNTGKPEECSGRRQPEILRHGGIFLPPRLCHSRGKTGRRNERKTERRRQEKEGEGYPAGYAALRPYHRDRFPN